MASVQDLKKNVNYVLGDIIEAVYIWELTNPEKETKKSQAIIDDAIFVFDELIEKINKKDVDNRKKHFKSVSAELETKGRALIEKINKKDVDNRKKHFKSVSAELETKGRALIEKINNL